MSEITITIDESITKAIDKKKISSFLLFSIGIHVLLLALIAIASIRNNSSLQQEEAAGMPFNAIMVNIADFAPTPLATAQTQPEPPPAVDVEPVAKQEPKIVKTDVSSTQDKSKKPAPIKQKQENKRKPAVEQAAPRAAEPAPVTAIEQKSTIAPASAAATTNQPQTRSSSSMTTSAAENIGNPQPRNRIQPDYPDRARALGIEGKVVVQFDVSTKGRIENIRILSATPKNVFDKVVKQAIKRWRYEEKMGKNLVVTILFKLDGTTQLQ